MKIINRLIWGAAAIAGTVAIIGWVASSEEESPAPPATAISTTAPTTKTITITAGGGHLMDLTALFAEWESVSTTITAGGGHLMDLAALFAEWESVQTSLEAGVALLDQLCTTEILEDLFSTRGAAAVVEHMEECAGIPAQSLETIRRWRSTVQQFTQQRPESDAGWEILRVTDEMIGALEILQEDIDAQVEEGRALLEDLGLG